MSAEKPKRNRTGEYARKKAKAKAAADAAERAKNPFWVEDREPRVAQSIIDAELMTLASETAGNPMDADSDIDFAYRNAGNSQLTPLQAPSIGAWQWYIYARTVPEKFLEITAKREDAKRKQAGTITGTRMEDDKRKQFAILDRIERQLTIDVRETVRDLMLKFPEDVLDECRRQAELWNAYFEKKPL